jgi:hypothetical protein
LRAFCAATGAMKAAERNIDVTFWASTIVYRPKLRLGGTGDGFKRKEEGHVNFSVTKNLRGCILT